MKNGDKVRRSLPERMQLENVWFTGEQKIAKLAAQLGSSFVESNTLFSEFYDELDSQLWNIYQSNRGSFSAIHALLSNSMKKLPEKAG